MGLYALLVPQATLIFMLAMAIIGVASPGPTALLVVLLADVMWLFWNGPIEGPVLLRFTHGHGLTVGDLLILASLPAALLSVDRLMHQRRRE